MLGLDHSAVIGSRCSHDKPGTGPFTHRSFRDECFPATIFLVFKPVWSKELSNEIRQHFRLADLSGGTPAAGVNVWVEDAADGRVVESVLTRESGAYKLGSLPPGAYNLVFFVTRWTVGTSGRGFLERGLSQPQTLKRRDKDKGGGPYRGGRGKRSDC